MPEMGGAEAITIIRERERTSGAHQPIIAVTAHAMKGDRERCLQVGADSYIAKPMTARGLLEGIEAAVAVPGRPAAPLGTGQSGLLAALGGDQTLAREIALLFAADGPAGMDQVRAALARGDAAGVTAAAHKLRGSAANFATPLVQTLSDLEQRAADHDLTACPELVGRAERELAGLLADLHRDVEALPCAS
jgi:CheY-like chemotaxis protein